MARFCTTMHTIPSLVLFDLLCYFGNQTNWNNKETNKKTKKQNHVSNFNLNTKWLTMKVQHRPSPSLRTASTNKYKIKHHCILRCVDGNLIQLNDECAPFSHPVCDFLINHRKCATLRRMIEI